MDVADIGWGDDFVQAIDARLARADVVTIIVGKHWLEMLQARQRGDDWVRREVTTALRLRAASLTAGGKARSTVAALWRDNAWAAVNPGLALRRGDIVQTGARGALVIAYSNGSVLYVGASTRGRVGSFTELAGRVFVKVKGLFEVETCFVKAGAKGTAYEVVATANGGARVVVVDGIVELSSRSAAWPAVALGAGTRAAAYPQAPVPAQASVAALQSIESWVRPLEQLPTRADAGSTAKAVAVAVGIAAIVAIILGARNDDKKRPNTPAGTPAGTAP